jgi:hypothetical protein
VLLMASRDDEEVPAELSAALATRLGAQLLQLPDSHVGPLLGRCAARRAQQAVRWLNDAVEFTGD